MKKPRYYQEESVESALKSIQNKDSNPLIVLPTGSGKSLVISLIIQRFIKENPDKCILVVSHVKEILQQNYDELIESIDSEIDIGVYSAGIGRKDVEQVTVVSVQSGRNNPEVFKHVGLVIVDEAHLVSEWDAGTYRKFLSNFDANIIGLTATPYRASGYIHLSEEALFTEICCDYTSYENFNKLTRDGFISKLYSKATDCKLEIPKGVATIAGDYSNNDLDILFDNERVTEEALKELKIIYDSGVYKKILVFCINIKHSELVSDMMNDVGIKTSFVHSRMEGDRSEEIDAFRNGELEALTNVNTLTTGLDIPDIDLIVMLRPTKSLSLYQQMVGRGLRVCKGKDHCLVLDFAGNVSRLGPINYVNIDQKGKPQKGGDAPTKECPAKGCGCLNHPIAKFCVACGYEFKFKVKITPESSGLSLTKRQESKTLKVRSVTYNKHKKKGKPDSLRIDYMVGLRKYARWLSVESFSMYAANIARYEIPKMIKDGEQIDGSFTVDNLIKQQNKFKDVDKIVVDVNDKWPKIEEIIYFD